MKFGLPENILRAIIHELQKRENITRASIFGSVPMEITDTIPI